MWLPHRHRISKLVAPYGPTIVGDGLPAAGRFAQEDASPALGSIVGHRKRGAWARFAMNFRDMHGLRLLRILRVDELPFGFCQRSLVRSQRDGKPDT